MTIDPPTPMPPPAAPRASGAACADEVYWFGLRIALPQPWDCIGHSCNPDRGALTFADRYRQRLQVLWTRCGSPPALDRMAEDYIAAALGEDSDGDGSRDCDNNNNNDNDNGDENRANKLHESRVTARREPDRLGWVVVRRENTSNEGRSDAHTEAVTRLLRYDEPSRRLIEAVLHHAPDDASLVEALAHGIIVERDDRDGGAQRWRLHGLDVTTPEGWTIRQINAKPADITFHFMDQVHPRGQHAATVRRYAGADGWFDGDLEHFARKRCREAKWDIASLEITGDTDAGAITAAGAGVDAGTDARTGADVGTNTNTGHGVFLHGSPHTTRWRRILRLHPAGQMHLRHDADHNAVLVTQTQTPARCRDPHPALTVAATAVDTRNTTPSQHHAYTDTAAPPTTETASHTDTDRATDRTLATAAWARAVPCRNAAVTASRRGAHLVLRVPIARRWWFRPPLTWAVPLRNDHGFALDALGTEVWSACDGMQNVEQIVAAFARRHTLRFHEARITVTTFLRTLAERRLIVLQVQRPPSNHNSTDPGHRFNRNQNFNHTEPSP